MLDMCEGRFYTHVRVVSETCFLKGRKNTQGARPLGIAGNGDTPHSWKGDTNRTDALFVRKVGCCLFKPCSL